MTKGRKNDIEKLDFSLVPIYPLYRLVEVYTIGKRKYDAENWRKGIGWKRIYAAMMRHATAWMAGETFDREDGQHHLASVAWCAFTLLEYEQTKKSFDDRVCSMPPNAALLGVKSMQKLLRQRTKDKKRGVSAKTIKKLT